MLNNTYNRRRILTATLLSTLLISALTATLFINDVTSQQPPPNLEQRRGYVSVVSPKSKVYGTTEIPLQVHAIVKNPMFNTYTSFDKLLSVQYWLDGQLVGQQDGENLPIIYSVVLTGLSDGEHSVIVWMKGYVYYQYMSVYSDTVYFTVDTSPPSIRFLTSQETFEASDVPVNFTVNEPVSWVGYSLDGKNVVTATDQVASTEWFGRVNYQLVLSGLPAGEHSLTVYTEDLVGNRGASQPFTITQQTSSETEPSRPEIEQTEPAPTTLIAVTILVSAVAVGAGLLLYFKKRKL